MIETDVSHRLVPGLIPAARLTIAASAIRFCSAGIDVDLHLRQRGVTAHRHDAAATGGGFGQRVITPGAVTADDAVAGRWAVICRSRMFR